MPPLSPAPDGFTTVATTAQMRAAIASTPLLGNLSLYLPEGAVLPLEGAPIDVGPINLRLVSEGEGAMLDAEEEWMYSDEGERADADALQARLAEAERQRKQKEAALANAKEEREMLRTGQPNCHGASVLLGGRKKKGDFSLWFNENRGCRLACQDQNEDCERCRPQLTQAACDASVAPS